MALRIRETDAALPRGVAALREDPKGAANTLRGILSSADKSASS